MILLVTACTSEADAPSETDPLPPTTSVPLTTTSTVVSVDPVGEFRDCLADNGVEIEEVPLDATGRPRLDLVVRDLDLDDQATADAMALCSLGLGSGALDTSGEEQLGNLIHDQLAAFSECVRSRGVAGFPDPAAGFSGVGSPYAVAEIPYSDPALPAAVASCRETVLTGLP